jgi:hypothetical protein
MVIRPHLFLLSGCKYKLTIQIKQTKLI